MENAIASLLMISVLLFAVMSVSNSYFATQDALMVSEQALEARMLERRRTDVTFDSFQVLSLGSVVEALVTNSGDTRLWAFDRWDVVIEYETLLGAKHIKWLPYDSSSPGSNEWTVLGIYQDAVLLIPEKYEPGIFNPGETLILQAVVSPPIGLLSTNRLTLSVENGISISQTFP